MPAPGFVPGSSATGATDSLKTGVSDRLRRIQNVTTRITAGPRCPLVVSVSDDDGWTWRQALVLDDGGARVDPAGGFAPGDGGVVTSGTGEYSYPTVVLEGDRLLVSYTWQRRGIVLAQVPLADLTP